jgi:enolase
MTPTDPTIVAVYAREVLDSRGRPTVEAEVYCRGGAWGRAIVPSGASTGRHEAIELRDRDLARHGGLGVRRAIANAREVLGPRVIGLPATDQALVDRALCDADGTPDKSRLGANAILSVSLACAHAAAAARGLPLWQHLDVDGRAVLPLPMVNMISGGLHAGGNLDLQDFLLLPIGARSFAEALAMATDVYRTLGRALTRRGHEGVLIADEGGFGPRLGGNEEAVEMLLEAITDAGLTPGRDAAVALDVAATQLWRDGRYRLRERGGGSLDAAGMTAMLRVWAERYPILSIEDGLAEDDWDGWRGLTAALAGRVQLVGDDLFVTNADRLRRGITEGVANAVLVKMNQAGTLTETLGVLGLARQAGYRAVISARSGETEDTTLADLAVASGAGQVKIGSVARGERLAKYNQLLRIAESIGEAAFARWTSPGASPP